MNPGKVYILSYSLDKVRKAIPIGFPNPKIKCYDTNR